MKSFTYKTDEKLNTGSNKGKTSGRPAAPQRTAHSLHSLRTADDRGFSLPEIIVAMLLVGIVIVPLLTNFAVSARVNAKSLKTKDVTAYAEQILETLQSYTPDEVDEQFGGSVDDFKIADISDRTDFGYTNSSFEIGKNDDGNSTDAAKKAAQGQPRYYYIRGAEAPSGRTYDIQVTYDPTSYSRSKSDNSSDGTSTAAPVDVHAYNLEEFPDARVFSRGSTAIINPSDPHITFSYDDDQNYTPVSDTSYEESAVDSMYSVYTAFLDNLRARFQDILDERMGSAAPRLTRNDFTSTVSVSEKDKKQQIRNAINRYTLIMVDADNDNGRIKLSAYMQFFLENSGSNDDELKVIDAPVARTRAKDTLEGLIDTETDKRIIEDTEIDSIITEIEAQVRTSMSSELVPSYNVFWDDEGRGKLDTVYLMTKPLLQKTYSDGFKDDRIAVYFTASAGKIYNSGNRLNMYIVPQTGLLGDNDDPGKYIKPEITGVKEPKVVYDEINKSHNLTARLEDMKTGLPSGKISVHYAKDWFDPSNIDYDSNLKDNMSSELVKKISSDFIYDIKVTVYESSGGKWKNKLAELDTSGQQQ